MALDEQHEETLEVAQQRRRLETLGRLAGNVVHDFNNLLMVIDGYARMLLEEPQLSRSAQESAEEILRASGRAAAFTQQLLAFSRGKSLEPKPVDLNLQLTQMRPMLMRLLGETVMLDYELSAEPALILAHLSQVEQVLLNLIVNARDAMPVGGRIVVRTRLSPDRIFLDFEDNGAGIPADLQPRIFEPFFTTKPEGKGTGIGLAMVAETVAEWAGQIQLSSAPGQGAQFVLDIPRLKQVAEEPAEAGKEGIILVVEDEDAVRALIRRVLEQRHYQVFEAASEDAAIEMARQQSRIDLLITDLEIKGGQGKNVASMVRLLHPDVRVMFISGYLQDSPGPEDLALQKPFSPKTLVLGVQHLLKSQ
ncbi:MAG: ATP-binding protein [Acidobacteria bacterium]|nr:ATP-binding protein [Acidobacteriota bacterium]